MVFFIKNKLGIHKILMCYFRSCSFSWNSPIPPPREDEQDDQDIEDDMEVNQESYIGYR